MSELNKYTVKLGKRAQGTVIGDGNVVYQYFHTAPIEKIMPMAPPPPPGFTGRDQILTDLSELLQTSLTSFVLALWGNPGIGKSALARALAHRVGENFPDGCLWADVREVQGNKRAILEGFSLSLSQDPRPFPTIPSLLDRVRALVHTKRILLVLDNVSTHAEVDTIVELLGQSATAMVLTTRSHKVAADLAEHAIEIEPLTSETAEQLLRYHSQLSAEVDLKEIVTQTGGIPLLIQAVGRQIRQTRPERKLEVVHRLKNELRNPVQQLSLAIGDVVYQDVLMLNYQAAPAEAQRVLRLMGLLSPQPVRDEMLSTILNLAHDALLELLETLTDFALVERVDTKTYRLPGVIHAFAAKVAQQSSDTDTLFHCTVTSFCEWIDQVQGTEVDESFQAQLAHYLTLFEFALTRRDWDTLHQLTDLTRQPITVSGRFRVIYDTRWPLVQLNLSFEDNSYIDQVDWRGAIAGNFHFNKTWLRNVHLAGARLGNLHFEECTLSSVDMRGVFAGNIHLSKCNIEAWDLRGATLGNIYFENCRLTRVSFGETLTGKIYLTESIVAETELESVKENVALNDSLLINIKNGDFDGLYNEENIPQD